MSGERNKTLIRYLLEEVWNRGNLALADDLVTRAYVGHDPHAPGGAFFGTEGYKAHYGMLRAAIPDARAVIEDVLADGDRTAVRFTLSGTHGGDLMGIPPTTRSIRISGFLISRFVGDKIVEEWGLGDYLGLLQQVGAVPGPGLATASP